jgi:hypothetical protein
VRTFRETLQRPETGDELDADAAAEPSAVDRSSDATFRVRITDVKIEHPGLLVGRNWLLPNESMTVRIAYRAVERTDDLLFGISIFDQDGDQLFGTNTRILGVEVPAADGECEACFEFDDVPLLDGAFLVTLAIQSADEETVYDWREQQYQFSVMNPSRAPGIVSFPVDVQFSDAVGPGETASLGYAPEPPAAPVTGDA